MIQGVIISYHGAHSDDYLFRPGLADSPLYHLDVYHNRRAANAGIEIKTGGRTFRPTGIAEHLLVGQIGSRAADRAVCLPRRASVDEVKGA